MIYNTDSNKYWVTCSRKSFETPPENGSAECVEEYQWIYIEDK